MNAEYKINSIADFLAVPHEKQAECLRDFGTWLNMARDHAEFDQLMKQALGDGLSFKNNSFVWIDDGIAGITALQIEEDGSDRTMRINFGDTNG